jgi:glycosyltransferase involved in cell wall biosynthesis
MQNNHFVFITPTYNSEATCRQTILSLAAQSYQNWKLIVIDDMSTDNTRRVILDVASSLGLWKYGSNSNKIDLIINKEKKWEVENTLIGLSKCKDDDIIARIDLDDYLTDNNALEILNMVYNQNPKLDAVWSAHRWFSDEDGLTNTNISGPLPKGTDPYKIWVSSHLKTFKKSLLNNVKDENYRGKDGKYFKRIGDRAFMLPALYNAREWLYIPLVFYAYRCSQRPQTFQTEDARFQAEEASYLSNRGYIK